MRPEPGLAHQLHRGWQWQWVMEYIHNLTRLAGLTPSQRLSDQPVGECWPTEYSSPRTGLEPDFQYHMHYRTELWFLSLLQSQREQSKGPILKHKFEDHESDILNFVFCRTTSTLMVGGFADGTLRKWDCNMGLLIGEPWKWEGGRMLHFHWTDRRLHAGEVEVGPIYTKHWQNGVNSLAYSPSGDRTALGGSPTNRTICYPPTFPLRSFVTM
jgi:WD40 repeat protein